MVPLEFYAASSKNTPLHIANNTMHPRSMQDYTVYFFLYSQSSPYALAVQ